MANGQNKKNRGSILLGLSGLLFLAGAVLVGSYFLRVRDATASGTEAASPSGSVEPAAVQAMTDAVERYLKSEITLVFGDKTLSVPRGDLGAEPDAEAIGKAAARADGAGVDIKAIDFQNYEGGIVPVTVDREVAEQALLGLKPDLDLGPRNAYLDLEKREVVPERAGRGIELFGSVSAIESAIRSGATKVELEGAEIPAEITIETLGIDNISTVISSFKTKFSIAEKTRNDNLKLLASMIDGVVLKPGEEFSFNDHTGMRTLEDGFKMAHVITAGEMVDGMAGGSCQISTTLHGAAFFGGLEILKTTPHSRPSTYVEMGLDSTVVAGRVDLKVRNPYEFPVAIHYKVARGEAYVEILGREKPFDRVEFEREVVERLPFETVTREDMEIGIGHMVVDQPGYPGYKVKRTRRIYKGKKVLRTDRWNLQYRPVIEYARLGINPNPNLPPPKQKKPHGPKPVKEGKWRMFR